MFVINIHDVIVLTSIHCFQLKYESSVHNIAFSRTSEKVASSESGVKYAQIKYCLLVDHANVFISCLNSHSDGTHSLQRINWLASDIMLNFMFQ